MCIMTTRVTVLHVNNIEWYIQLAISMSISQSVSSGRAQRVALDANDLVSRYLRRAFKAVIGPPSALLKGQ